MHPTLGLCSFYCHTHKFKFPSDLFFKHRIPVYLNLRSPARFPFREAQA